MLSNAGINIKKILSTATLGIVTLSTLSGCVVSDDPAVNAIATTAAVGTVAGLIYYSNDDGYYYDDRYNRMPRGYRPAYDARIRRIDSMDAYRRRQMFDRDMLRQRQENRLMQNRLDNQRRENRLMQERLERGREQNMRMRQQMEQQRIHNDRMRGQMQYQQEDNRLRREMQQRRRSDQIREIQQHQHQPAPAERNSLRVDTPRTPGNNSHIPRAKRIPAAWGDL